MAHYKSDKAALQLIKAYADQRRPDPPEHRTEERAYPFTQTCDDVPDDKVEVTVSSASLSPPIKNTMVRIIYDFEEVDGAPYSRTSPECKGDAASPEYNFSDLLRIERPSNKGWKKFERLLNRRKMVSFALVEAGGWFSKETVKGTADWLNPKLLTRPEDKGKNLPSKPGPNDFGALRTRVLVSRKDLEIYDVDDREKQIGTLSVTARVRHPLLGSDADVTQRTYSDAERHSLVFAEDTGALDAVPVAHRPSLGAVPDRRAAEPPAPKRGGAAKAAARAKKPATSSGSTPAGDRAAGGSGDSGLEAVAQQYKVPVALLQRPDSVSAYIESYDMVSQQMQLIGMEIQENMAAGFGANGMPKKTLSPEKMKTFQLCQKSKDKMEADMQSGALTPAAYAQTLAKLIQRDARLIQALKHIKKEKEQILVAHRIKSLKNEREQVTSQGE